MKTLIYIILLLILNSCSIFQRPWNCIVLVESEGESAFNEMQALIRDTNVDTNKVKSVKIYSYELKKNGKVKDSSLIEYQNLNYDYSATYSNHTTYEVKYDSLGRDVERYATDVESGKTHLNYRKTYDSNSKLTQWTVFNGDGQINSKTFYFYDNKQRLLRSEKYYGYFLYDKPPLAVKTEFEYESETLVKETTSFFERTSGKLESRSITQYNKEGEEIDYRSQSIENDSIVSFSGVTSSFNKQKLDKKIDYTGSDDKIMTEYTYNSLGLPVKVYLHNLISKKPIQLIKYYYQEDEKTINDNQYE